MVFLRVTNAARPQFIDQCLGFVLVQSRPATVFEREMFEWNAPFSISNEIKILDPACQAGIHR
jgi:hypothetical protein